ncbi:hypothetical protein LAZ67_3002555 [Cordylochernes scorpioides]|uniref:Reverse transcriptase domain-containing protein n=1 Tax=Cordylochernes scorpioides TaxID=51811 RepID=A0ABY6K863_9ARAC|nr:hypothetical protein LAZ67_3002555 [Cordylochernes scorpioides]
MEDTHVDDTDKLLRLPNYLARQPLELFRKLRLVDRNYFQVRQILLDLYPDSSEASFAKYFAMKLTGQADLETYYREKTAMGLQLGLPQEVILETLTEGLPFSDQRLVRVVPPENLGEWFRLAQRIHGPSVPTTRHIEDQTPPISGPYHNTPRRTGAWNAPPPPSNYTGARLNIIPYNLFNMLKIHLPNLTLKGHSLDLQTLNGFAKTIEKLQLNFAKCEFFKQSIDFLGYTITAGTTTPLTRNTDIIHAIKQPHNRKTLQSFLGAVNVYNKFIPEYARLRAPLNNLLKKDVVWIWDEACQKAFIALKGDLTQHPILHLYKEGLPCQVYCDASTLGIAGIPKQVHPRRERISSSVFQPNSALQWLKTIKNPSGRLFRWSLRLSSYEYEVRYIKGKQQYEADLLFRNPFCGFLDATLIKTHQTSPSKEFNLTIDRNGLHTVSRKGVTKIIIPKTLIPQLLQTVHAQYKHPGISQMSRLISTQYYWQDTIAGFAKYGNTKIYLHVVVDHFSRYAWTFPSKSTSITTYQQFDAAHLPTRVARHGDQVESSRLDRILVPAEVLDRVSIYATSHYYLSDHRLVLLQVGPPTTAVSSPTQPRLAAMLRSGFALEHQAGYIRELEEDTAHDDDDGTFWDRWTSIKAGLLAEARSLHDPRHAASDSYVYRARRYIAGQLEASSIRADYPSLPDLARAIRLRRPARGGRGLDGYRPVALPSADYRVLAAILHRRLKPHLRTLVPECQTYAVPGRSPSWNIAMVTDAVEEATALGSPLAVMGIDLESAFDSLDRGFLESLLTSIRLPPSFRAWINILYAGADATIRAGGFYTTAFPLLNGLRQGCAVSAALFSIATGPLLRRLELTLGVGNVIAYADDIVLLFHRDGAFERGATVFEEYKQASGVGVNLRKSAGLWCGAWRNRGDSPFGASWSTTSIRVLGLDIAPRSTVAHREQHLLALLETACRRWTPFTRGLSLVGRARAANTLVGSVIQHHLHGYLPSPSSIANLQARLARFVWGQDHTAWLPADVMARRVAIGGLGLLDLATQLQLACLKGVQVALRGGRNAFSWLVESGEAWIHPPPDGTRLQPRRLRLLKLWEEASNILGLNHRALPTAQLLDLPIIGGCRFLRPPDLLAPARWRGA